MLNSDIVAALPGLRAQAESLMVDTVLIQSGTGEPTIDAETLEEVEVFSDVYVGPARVQRPGSLSPRDDVVGGVEFGIQAVLVQLPLSVTGVEDGMRITVTEVAASTDPDLLGLVATVRANLTKTHPTKRTLVCEVTA